jgi:hypothetical protein
MSVVTAPDDLTLRLVPGAEHSVWYSHFDEFVATLPEAFGPDPVP